MRIVCISDTHLRHKFDIPHGDILIHSGDATFHGYRHEIVEFAEWFRNQPHMHKVFVAGNHDRSFEDTPTEARLWLQSVDTVDDDGFTQTHQASEPIIYLQDSDVELEVDGETVKIYGAPWQPYFGGWAFNLHQYTGELEAKWDLIPSDTDVLITHGPPYGLRDANVQGEPCGCTALRRAIRRVQPKLHVCGHIHEAYGTSQLEDTIIANASTCNHRYIAVNPPLVFEYKNGKMYQTS